VLQVSALMDMVRARFQTTVGRLAIMDCELRWDDIILDVIRDGDVVEGITSGTSASARRNGDHGSSTKGSGPRQSLGDSHSARDADHGTAGQAGSSRGMSIHDRYRKLQKFKGGVMGTVFKAQDMASKGLYREVVVKLLQTGATRERQERFLREAKIVAGLNHPNIINYVDMGQEHDGTLYIVMEAVNGPDLQFILDHERYLFEDETLTIIKGVLNGLACTHAMHVVHRDLKPANILVLLKGNAAPTKRRDSKSAPRTPLEVLSVKIIDFGLARELSSSSLLTGENVVGTPMYFAPEQTISGAEISTLTDIWAVGVLIFHAICGTLPFAKLGDPLQVIVHEICTKPPPDLCAASQGRASPELRTVVESALQKNTHRRLPSAEVMLQRIHEVQSQHHPFSHRGQAQAPGASPRSAVVTVLGDATATAAHKHAAKSEKHLRHELAQLEQALQGREQQARVAQQQQSKLLQQHKEQQREIESLQEKLRDLTRANDDFHHTIKTQHQEAARAKQRMVDLQQENQRLQSRSQHKQAVDDELRSQEVEALKSEVEQLRSSNAALQVEVEESTTVLREKTQSLDTTQRHVKQVIQQALSKDKQIKEYERELKDASAKLLSMTAERDAAQERAQEAQQKALRDQQDWKKERQAIQQQLDSLQAEAARSAAVPAEHAALGAEAQRRMREAHELKDKAEAELRRTIEELSKSREAAAAAEHRAQQQLVQVNELKAELTSNHKGASEEEWKAKLGEVAALQLELASHKQQIGVLQQRLEAADAQQIALQVDLEARVAAENGARLRAETAEQMLSRSSRELQQVREQARLLRLQVEELEGDLKFEQDAVEQHKAALQKVRPELCSTASPRVMPGRRLP
jgi:serine/threonine protein kinase